MGSIEVSVRPQVAEPKLKFSADANTEAYARNLDAEDPLRSFRDKFIIPSKANLKSKGLSKPGLSNEDCIYFCGNSLGLQPKVTAKYLEAHLDTWSGIAVNGHFTDVEGSPLVQWQSLAETAAAKSTDIVGASASEIAIMGSLTSNLHMLMASFYTPTPTKHKIILEWKAFPSDHYAIESQVRWHGLNPEESMVMIGPEEGEYVISTEKILSVIDEHAETTALLLLPGIQYYSGQLFDMETITAYAQSKGLIVGWDLAHAAGNVPLKLHDWNVDFAAWCTYKYINAGPGAIAGLFVHERHGKVDYSAGEDKPSYRPRLMGWYGGDTSSRFKMDNKFKPLPGAGGFQQSNPSVVDIASLSASLSVFAETSMAELRQKSLKLTAYLEHLLLSLPGASTTYRIITPSEPEWRGAQLCLLLIPGLLPKVAAILEANGIIIDQRKPDVMRVAPLPLYNTYSDVWQFVQVFSVALKELQAEA